MRFGLDLKPAMPLPVSPDCSNIGWVPGQVGRRRDEPCGKDLDARGHHAATCSSGGGLRLRHDRTRDALAAELRRAGVHVKQERWVPDLAYVDSEGNDKQARLDLVVRLHDRELYIDITAFHPYVGSGRGLGSRRNDWRPLHHEREKFRRYPTRRGGRRMLAEGAVVPIAVSSLGLIGEVGADFLTKARLHVALRKGVPTQSAPDFLLVVEAYIVHGTTEALLKAYGTQDGASRPLDSP